MKQGGLVPEPNFVPINDNAGRITNQVLNAGNFKIGICSFYAPNMSSAAAAGQTFSTFLVNLEQAVKERHD